MGEGPQPVAAKSNQHKADFISDTTTVDFRGGQRLSGRRGSGLCARGEVLLLDPDGILMVRNDFEDQATFEKISAAAQPPDDSFAPRENVPVPLERFEGFGERGFGP